MHYIPGRWDWHVRLYYNETVDTKKTGKVPHELAIEIGGLTKEALDMDISVGKERKDIGRIVLIHPNGYEEELVK